MHQMVYILMLLWQHTQSQIAIMQEWLPLYLILSKHCPLRTVRMCAYSADATFVALWKFVLFFHLNYRN